MKRWYVLSIVAGLALSTSAPAQYGHAGRATASQPTQGLARIDEQGQLEVREVMFKPVFETQTGVRKVTAYQEESRIRTETVIQDGEQVQVEKTYTVKVPVEKIENFEFTVCIMVPETKSTVFVSHADGTAYVRKLDQVAVGLFETDGKPAIRASLSRRLQDWSLVLLTHDGKPAPDYYAYLFKPGTLVLALPQPAADAPMLHPGPAPAPAPPAVSSVFASPREIPVRLAAFQNSPVSDVEFPASPPPDFKFAQIGEPGTLRLRTLIEFSTQQTGMCTEQKPVLVEGVTKTVEACRPVQMTHIVRTNDIWVIPLDSVTATTGDGRSLSSKELTTQLTKETTVLVSRDGRPVDPFWLRNLTSRALVLVTPPTDCGWAEPPLPHVPASPVPPQESPAPRPETPIPTPPVEAPAPSAPGAPVSLGQPEATAPLRPLNPSIDEPVAVPKFLSAAELELFKLTNKQRMKEGLPPLRASETLCRAARQHAARMAELNLLNHTIDGVTFDQRLKATGYQFSAAGENISNASSASTSLQGWMNSPGHRQNILSAEYHEVGIGMSTNAIDRRYWVQVFATPVKGP